MKKINAAMMSLAACGVLAGCASVVQSRVAVSYETGSSFEGMTYAFVMSEEQRDGMEETAIENADEVEDGTQIVSSYPVFGQIGIAGTGDHLRNCRIAHIDRDRLHQETAGRHAETSLS